VAAAGERTSAWWRARSVGDRAVGGQGAAVAGDLDAVHGGGYPVKVDADLDTRPMARGWIE
jgi:hypothetical protein